MIGHLPLLQTFYSRVLGCIIVVEVLFRDPSPQEIGLTAPDINILIKVLLSPACPNPSTHPPSLPPNPIASA